MANMQAALSNKTLPEICFLQAHLHLQAYAAAELLRPAIAAHNAIMLHALANASAACRTGGLFTGRYATLMWQILAARHTLHWL